MRFDLEFNIVEQLTQEGLSLLAESFYSDDNDEQILTPAKWDNVSPLNKRQINKGDISLAKLQEVKLPSWLYSSGTETGSDLSLDKMILRNNLICPIFNAGSVYTYKNKSEWSNHSITKLCSIEDGRYVCEIDSDTNIDSLNVFTLKLDYPGYLEKEREYTYVKYDDISIDSTFAKNKKGYSFTVIDNKVYLSGDLIIYNEAMIGYAYADKSNLIALPQFPIMQDSNGSDLITIKEPIEEDQYRILTSVVRVDDSIGVDTKVFASYTVAPIVIYKQLSREENIDKVWRNINLTPSAISFKGGLICLYNILGTAGGTIRTCDGATILMPTSLDISSNKDILDVLETVKVTATLSGIDGIPVKGATIDFSLESLNGDAVFLETNEKNASVRTGLDGKVDVNAIVGNIKFGWYVQKEWIYNDYENEIYQLRLPFKLSTQNPEDIFLYFITADDPILGKKYADSYLKYRLVDQMELSREGEIEKPFEEYYTNSESLGAYTLNGRKIAWIKMRADTDSATRMVQKLQTYYVKPRSIELKQITSTFRDLYIKNTDETMGQYINDLGFLNIKTPYIVEATGYAPGILPLGNEMQIMKADVAEGTVIEYDEPIPDSDNIAGFWLVTSSSGDMVIKSEFNDECNLIKLESQEIKIKIGSQIKSESEFILSSTELDNYNTALNSFGYYTPSEYIDNPFHMNSCVYACRWSDAIQRKCRHPNKIVREKYLENQDNGTCLHTAEYDANIVWEDVCPVVNKYLRDEDGSILLEEGEPVLNPVYEQDATAFVNPFILHVEK